MNIQQTTTTQVSDHQNAMQLLIAEVEQLCDENRLLRDEVHYLRLQLRLKQIQKRRMAARDLPWGPN